MKSFTFDIDVVGTCNLRCPSCPQGNLRDVRLPQGRMAPELLGRIVDKALAECRVERINLFNWCEPLLHPRIHELVRIVQARGVGCYLSSNLNLLPDPDAVMAANPAGFKISVSGFTQEVYGVSHRGGDIERVKKHMAQLADARRRQGATTQIVVNYHRYRHNLKDLAAMRAFSLGLGFGFEPVWALLLPVENLLAHPEGEDSGPLATGDNDDLVGNLALPLGAALAASARAGDPVCPLRESQISMDFQGNLQLCCGTYDSGKYTLGNYLELPLEEIQQIRRQHPLCGSCMRHGAHLYLTYRTPGLDELVLGNLAPEDVERFGLRRELSRQRRRQWLRRAYQSMCSGLLSQRQNEALQAALRRLLGGACRPKP